MAANGITVKPIRMGDLVSNTPSSGKVPGKYTPPSKRVGPDGKVVPVVENIDMSDKNFPSLGAAAAKTATWGKHVVKPVVSLAPKPEPESQVEKKETLSDKIKEKIRLDAIAESGRANLVEKDHWSMTDEELAEAGWVRLRMKSAQEICQRGFSNQDDTYLPGFITEADSGMSYDEYRHYKNVYDPASMTIPPRNTPCSINGDGN
jgi:hypothetical protein